MSAAKIYILLHHRLAEEYRSVILCDCWHFGEEGNVLECQLAAVHAPGAIRTCFVF